MYRFWSFFFGVLCLLMGLAQGALFLASELAVTFWAVITVLSFAVAAVIFIALGFVLVVMAFGD